MPRKPEPDDYIRSAVEDVYSGLLARFRNTLHGDGYESAEKFVNAVLPYVRLILQRIDEELEEAKREHLEKSSPEGTDEGGVVDLDRLSNAINELLERIPSSTPRGVPQRRSLPPAGGAYRSPEEAAAEIMAGNTITPLPGQSSSPSRQTASGYGQAPNAPGVHPRAQYPDQPQYPGQAQYPDRPQYPGQAQHPDQPQYPGQAQHPDQPQYPGRAQYPDQPQYPAEVPVQAPHQSSAAQHHQGYGARGGYGNGAPAYDQQAPAEQAGGGRYGSGYQESEYIMPQQSEGYAPRQIDQLIRYSNIQRSRGMYEEAIHYLDMAKELPEFYIYDFYRDEVLDLEDRIEREHYKGAPTYVSNVMDTRYSGFDYISQKGKKKEWLEDDDY